MAFSLFRRKKDRADKIPAQTPADVPGVSEAPDLEGYTGAGASPEPDVGGIDPLPAPGVDGEKPDVALSVGGIEPDTEPNAEKSAGKEAGMFKRFRGRRAESAEASGPEQDTGTPRKKTGMFSRLKGALGRTRTGLVGGLSDFLRRRKTVDGDIVEEIETLLLGADVGVDATERVTADIAGRLKRRELKDPETVFRALRENMREILTPVNRPLVIPDSREGPFVILVVGVNGTGKTTTIGKLAKRLQADGLRVMFAAGDTFRAAAVEQLQIWGERNDVPVVAQKTGADSASVVYDALQSARARGFDVLVADTAGRLHTQVNLMEELKKVHRVIKKLDSAAPQETLLVLDAGTGQNALAQAKQFHEALGLTGIALTKLDGTAKGGVIFALAQRLAIPVRFIGVGEGIDDLREFDADEFVEALFAG